VILHLEAIRLTLGSFVLETDLALNDRVTALFGPSGAGKTTVLEIVAGLRRPSAGRITLNGRLLFHGATGTDLPARARRVGYVPQDNALFPHLSVEGNLRFGLAKPLEADERLGLAHVIELLELGSFLSRGIATLSGGEKKRVALARALVTAPELMLLDEPVTGLEHPLRDRVLDYLRRIRDELRVPMLYVTHQPEELAGLSESVVVMKGGKVTAQGTIAEVFAGPRG